MSELTTTISNQSIMTKIGWGLLLFVALGNVAGHTALAFFESGPDTVFIAWASFNFMTAVILFIPYRRGEKWAWYAICLMVIPFVLVSFTTPPEIGPIYLVETALIIVGQVLTYNAFFNK